MKQEVGFSASMKPPNLRLSQPWQQSVSYS